MVIKTRKSQRKIGKSQKKKNKIKLSEFSDTIQENKLSKLKEKRNCTKLTK